MQIKSSVPDEVKKIVFKMKKVKDKLKALRIAYDFLSKKYHGGRVMTYIRLDLLLETRQDKLWMRTGFLQCTQINRLLIQMLLDSRIFKSEDIKKKWNVINGISPHQYLSIAISKNKIVDVDIWANILVLILVNMQKDLFRFIYFNNQSIY